LFIEFNKSNKNFNFIGDEGPLPLEDNFIKLLEAKDSDTIKFCLDNMVEWQFKIEKPYITIIRRTNYSSKMREIFNKQIYPDSSTPLTVEIDFEVNNEKYFLKKHTIYGSLFTFQYDDEAVSKSTNLPLVNMKEYKNKEFTYENIKNIKITFKTQNAGKSIVITKSFKNFKP
jgi:hypothetical protein